MPFVYVPPPNEVEAVVAVAPLLHKIDALREYLDESGKPLTQIGNLKLADDATLIGLLDTGDQMEMGFDDHTYRKNTTSGSRVWHRSSTSGKRLAPFAFTTADWFQSSLGPAVRRRNRRRRCIGRSSKLGALGSRGVSYALLNTVDEVLDDSTVHWLAGLFDTTFGSSTIPTGGRIRLTALGRLVVPDDLADAGYVLKRLDDLADATALSLIDALDAVPDEHRQTVVDTWQPGLETRDRIGQIVDVIRSGVAALRFKGFAALELFDPAEVEPAGRGLLDGPTAGQAALYLLSRGLADESELGHLIDIGLFIDVRAASLDDLEELCEMFSQAPHSADQYAALEEMWRPPSPQTAAVLDALGEHLADKKLAKAARNTAMRHRGWMANRN